MGTRSQLPGLQPKAPSSEPEGGAVGRKLEAPDWVSFPGEAGMVFRLVIQSLPIPISISLLHDFTHPLTPPPALTSGSQGPELLPSLFCLPPACPGLQTQNPHRELMSPTHSTPHTQGSPQSTSTTIISVATRGLINSLQPCHHDNGTPTAPHSLTDSAHLPSFSIWTPFSLHPPPTPTPPGELGPAVSSGSLRRGKER